MDLTIISRAQSLIFLQAKANRQLQIHQRQNGDTVVLELEGRLILGPETEGLSQSVKKLLKAGKTKILLQLEKLSRIDSVGAGTIIEAVLAARAPGDDASLIRPSPVASKVLAVLGLMRRPDLLPVFPDEQVALKSFSASAPACALPSLPGDLDLALSPDAT
jgi:anti-anti-sigma factor